jgi:hypothetical protein
LKRRDGIQGVQLLFNNVQPGWWKLQYLEWMSDLAR